MQRVVWSIAGILAFLAGPALGAPAIDAFGQLPTFGDIALSPDGTRWAAIVGNAQSSEVQVRELTTGKLLLASPARDYKLRALQWADNDRVVLTLSQTKQIASTDFLVFGRGEYFQLLMHDLKTHNWLRPMKTALGTANFVAGPPVVRMVDGRTQLIVEGLTTTGSSFTSTLFRIDPATGRSIPLEKGGAETVDWIIGVDGQPVARADYLAKDGNWRLMFKRGGFWTEVYREAAPIDFPSLLGLGRTPGTILVGSRKSGDYAVYEVALATAAWLAPVDSHGDDLVPDPASREPIGAIEEGLGSISYAFWNPDDQKLWRSITRSFKDEIVRLIDWSADRNIVMVEVFGAKSGAAIYVVDRKAKTAGLLGQRYERLAPADLGPVQTLTYTAGDGTAIPAYLTLPPGRGTIDPGRVCIVGGSYGGYAALAGVSVEQGVYRCASAIAGVSDLRRMLQREARDRRGSANPAVRYWQRFMGADSTADTRIDAWSPARLAARVGVPLQLIHGKDDLVVPMEQSNFMVSAMNAAGKPVEMVVLSSEDHWLSRPATRVAMLEALVGFLEKHNPPGSAVAAAKSTAATPSPATAQ